MSAEQIIEDWARLGRRVPVAGEDVFAADVPPAGSEDGPPLLVLHGFPTSSIDFAQVLERLRANRRVVLVDLPGYGLSDKPDRTYSLFGQADVVEAVAAEMDLAEVDLVTHDMGDSVGGELLARSLDGDLALAVRERVITNGSIYLGLAQLTDGQRMLEDLPDAQLPEGAGPDEAAMAQALGATMAPDHASDPEHLRAAAALVVRAGGGRLLPRLVRYLSERREHEERWTGAIERHPAPLSIVWGDQDPIAVWAMAEQLAQRRPDGRLVRLAGVGHYPMIEAPGPFAEAVLAG